MIYKKFNYFSGLYEKLRYALPKHNINLIPCPPKKLKEAIGTNIDPIPEVEIAGVYSIPFRTDCNNLSEYIGKPIENSKKRIKEHKADVKVCRQSTALSRLYLY